ncbi:MAG: aminoglycoside phosphotransferase family protein [Pyrinomonadaceae bacterium]|nr:aminoglycoside phosphotransferase family protein [Pyrinomonadaceae bacterium]
MNKNLKAELPEKFARNALGLCGAAGERWLNDLPHIIEEISENWQIEAAKPFANLSYNFVVPCVCSNGGKAVLKIALPLNNPEIFNEAKLLQTADGNGAVKLLKFDESRRAILLERLTPGANLKENFRGDESKAVEAAIKVLHGLPKNPPQHLEFRRLEEWFDNFFVKANGTKFPCEFQNKAHGYYEELSSATNQKILLHGDLHHENILLATREEFLALDPKGIIGEIGYEIAVFLNNHLWWLASELNLQKKSDDAVRQFSEAFAVEPPDLNKWAFAQMVLSAWWTFEENGENWQTDLALATIWEANAD